MRCCMTEGGPCFTGALSGVYESGAVTLSPLKAGLTAVSYNVIKNSCLEPISKSVLGSRLSFPQAKRVGNPSENKERFRTSRNDIRSGYHKSSILRYVLIIFAIASFPRRRESNLARNGCPIKTLGHDG
jgi:hypothetical protein